MEEQELKVCVFYRHRRFVRDDVCIVCNPDRYERYCNQIRAEGLSDYYDALVAGTECHWLKCAKPGVRDDGLGHWWCDEHIFHCLFLQEGAARNFPAWEFIRGHTILEGRPSWYKSAIHATPEDMMYRVAKLRGVSVEELRAQYEPKPEESEPVQDVQEDGGVAFEGEVYAILPQEVRDMMALSGEIEELDLSKIPF